MCTRSGRWPKALLLATMIFLDCVGVSRSRSNDKYSGKVSYKGYQLWKLKTDTQEKLDAVTDLDIVEVTKWGRNHTNPDVLISASNVAKVKEALAKSNIKHKVLIHDLQEEIDRQPIVDIKEMKLSQKTETFNLSSYHNLPAIRKYLYELCNKHSHLKLITIGKTLQNNPIELISIKTGNDNKKGIFIEAGLHAREWISPASVIYIITHFANNFHKESKDLQKMDWYFLPVGNPDGYAYSCTKDRLWRKNLSKWGNCFGTDLNRNFGFHWDEGDPNPCEETFSGSGPFSEPETIAIRDFITKFERAYWGAYISVHSYGQNILYPYGYTEDLPNNVNELLEVARIVVNAIKAPYNTEYTINSIAGIYVAAGVSIDWSRSIGIRYSYTIEVRDKGKFAFLLPDSQIIPTAEELMIAIRVIAESAYRDVSKKSIGG